MASAELWSVSVSVSPALPHCSRRRIGHHEAFQALEATWRENVEAVLTEATLTMPESGWMASGGKAGRHSEYLGFILADMQFLQRAYPGAKW